MKTDTPRTIHLSEYRPPAYLIDTVDLGVVLDAKATRVRARLVVRPNPELATAVQTPLRLDGEMLSLDRVALNGVELQLKDYTRDVTSLTIVSPPRGPFTLEIDTTVAPEDNKALQGLYRSRGVYCTQCEAQGFRRITYFIDRPDVLAVYTVRLEADVAELKALVLRIASELGVAP